MSTQNNSSEYIEPVAANESAAPADLVLVNSTALVNQGRTIAELCRDIVEASATNIQGKRYVCIEGWQSIAMAHGCTPSIRSVEKVDGGTRAIADLKRISDGQVISTAEGFVGDDEHPWNKRHVYAVRAMAQTRAQSRVCRGVFAHVVLLMKAGLLTTPAEEVPYGGFDSPEAQRVPVRPAPPEQVAQPAHAHKSTVKTPAPLARNRGEEDKRKVFEVCPGAEWLNTMVSVGKQYKGRQLGDIPVSYALWMIKEGMPNRKRNGDYFDEDDARLGAALAELSAALNITNTAHEEPVPVDATAVEVEATANTEEDNDDVPF